LIWAIACCRRRANVKPVRINKATKMIMAIIISLDFMLASAGEGGVCLKISERNWLGPACVETSAGNPPFRPPRLAYPTDRREPEPKGRFQVFLWRQIPKISILVLVPNFAQFLLGLTSVLFGFSLLFFLFFLQLFFFLLCFF